MINYIASHNIYDHPIVLHSYPDQKERYRPFLGDMTQLNGLSLQGRQNDYSDLRDELMAVPLLMPIIQMPCYPLSGKFRFRVRSFYVMDFGAL